MSTMSDFGRFHHLGVAVQNLAEAASGLCGLFSATVESEVFHDVNQGVRLQFILLGGLRLELLEPAATPSPLDNVLKRGVAIYHAAYEVDGLDERLSDLVSHGVVIVSPPKSAIAFQGRRVAFIMWKGVMIELIEAAR